MRIKADGSVDSYDDYYPYGMVMNGRSQTSSADARYKFTGKERDAEIGYDYFGARYYDYRIGRWLQIDPLADKYHGWSPYNYALCNPLRNIDPNGMLTEDQIEEKKTKEEEEKERRKRKLEILKEDQAKKETDLQHENKGAESFYFSQISYLPVEGVGVFGSFNIFGYSALHRNIFNNQLNLTISASGRTAASEVGDVFFWSTADLIINENIITTQSLKNLGGQILESQGNSYIGETTFALPNQGNVQIRLRAGYNFSGPEGNANPFPLMQRIINIGEIKIINNP